jgi:ferrous iron transport protein B
MEQVLPQDLRTRKALALLWLSGDRALIEELTKRLGSSTVETLGGIAAQAQERSSTSLGLLIAQARLREAQRLAKHVMAIAPQERQAWSARLGTWAMHPVWGLPIVAGVLALLYFLVGDLAAQRGVDFLEEVVFGRYVGRLLAGSSTASFPGRGCRRCSWASMVC